MSARLRRALTAVLIVSAVPVVQSGDPVRAADVASIDCSTFPSASAAPDVSLASFTGETPRRLVDTRNAMGGVQGPIDAGCTLRLDLDEAGVTADASAVALSVTALATDLGFITVFPCALGQPPTSNVNPRPGQIPTPNLVVAIPDDENQVCLFTLSQTELIVDLGGWWTDDGDQRFASIPPTRAYDSRIDDGGQPVPADSIRTIDLSSVVPAGTTSVVANLTVTEPAGLGFITAFGCGTPAPLASNLNFVAGENRAVAVIVGLGTGEELCVRSNVNHHVVLDVAGYYGPAPQFGPAAELRPQVGDRLADSRNGTGGWSRFGAGTVQRITPAAGLPFESQATAAVLNVIAVEADDNGFVTIYPCDVDRPETSAVNYTPGTQATNLVTVELQASGDICVYTLTGADVIVDLFGIMAAPDGALAERMSFDHFTWPPFTPDGGNHAVECGDSAFFMPLELDLLSGTTARVNGVPVTGSTTVGVEPDALTRVQLRRGATVRDYWFRCVPTGFPRLEVDRPGEPSPGWYLTNLNADQGQHVFTVILDERGAPAWYKRIERPVIDVKRRDDGRLLYTATTGNGFGIDPDRGYRVTSLTGTLIDEHLTVPDPADPGTVMPSDHHDYVTLPGGRRAMLSYPLLTGQDLSVLGTGYTNPPDTIVDGVIQEISSDDELEWIWRASDHFFYDEVTYPQRFGNYPAEPNGGEVDVFHLNGLSTVDDGSGDYIVTARHLDAVFRIDRATGDVAWILDSQPASTPNKSGGTRLDIVGDPLGGPLRPHDGRLDGDVLTLFDNRVDSGQPARAVAYQIDAGAGTATLLWQIDEPLGRESFGLGSVRVGSDGARLIDWGGGLQPVFQEYDAAGDLIMSITMVGGGTSYRIVKEPPSSFSAGLLRATAGGEADAP
ncbi:MAG: aryl-sulfate sulfotransferase [Ilumatobacter sp.]|uniref:aryl-sulfate sulfotransferase n=1 Tax=Ilumatobacter sp. TaxID=1967498 RepID=UPI002628920E|nr:aryl-sulfate sulfotransferase [Ilumatobacter sp.]MDJ0770573.1 aryl-sulfate sulfotransferase [Ilumatobacter sp.]